MRRLLLLSILILVLPASVSHAQGVGEWSIEWVTDMDRDVALEVDQDWSGEVTVRFTVSNERATEVRIQLEYRWDGDQEDLEFDGPSEVTVAKRFGGGGRPQDPRLRVAAVGTIAIDGVRDPGHRSGGCPVRV